MLTVVTRPSSTALASVGFVMQETKIADADRLGGRDGLIARASASIERFCHRSFARAVYLETVPGYGDVYLKLARRPVVNVASVTLQGDVVVDWILEDPEGGQLYLKKGWEWSAVVGWDLSAQVRPGTEEPVFAVTYTAGYLLPGDDRAAKSELSVDATDNSFNDSAGRMPLLVAGEQVTSSGFFNAANNGTFTVVSRTASKLVVSGGVVVTELGSATPDVKTLSGRTLPTDVMEALLVTVKGWELERFRDPNVISKSVGDLSLTYLRDTERALGVSGPPLPPRAVSLLTPYVELA